MQLVYRSQVINCPALPATSYRKPSALNWRFQAPGETYSESLPAQPYQAPRAINWRYQ